MQLDPGTAALAATTLSLLAPYLQTGAEEFAKSAGKSAFEQVQKLLARIRKQFEPDSEAKENLARFEDKPNRYRAVVEDILREKLSSDAKFAQELRDLLQAMGPTIKVVQELDEVTRVTGLKAKSIKSGDIDIHQTVKKGDDVTGVELDGDIG